ncbi:MAG: hypothetical protein OXD37_03050 [Acidimicrobiaceae bacterium]|nr:hypothetical protein [Acidimicrobiaceae bacterium]
MPSTLLELFRIKQGELLSALMHPGARLNLWQSISTVSTVGLRTSEQPAQE